MAAFSNCVSIARAAHRAEEEGNIEEANRLRNMAARCLLEEARRSEPLPHLPEKLINMDMTEKLTFELSDDPKKAMILATKIAEGFKEAGIKLGDNKTFAASLFIIDAPQYASQVISEVEGRPIVSFITNPVVMQGVADKMQQDRIRIK